jgi:hypothetical protein
MTLIIKEADLTRATEDLIVCAVNATTADGLRVQWNITPEQARKAIMGALVATCPTTHPDDLHVEGFRAIAVMPNGEWKHWPPDMHAEAQK